MLLLLRCIHALILSRSFLIPLHLCFVDYLWLFAYNVQRLNSHLILNPIVIKLSFYISL